MLFSKNCFAEQVFLQLSEKIEIPFGEINPSFFGLQYGDTLYVISGEDILGKDSSLLVYKVDSNNCIHNCFYEFDENTQTRKTEVFFSSDYKFFVKSEKDDIIPVWVGPLMLVVFFLLFCCSTID